jgi:alanine dehydrogenase
MMIVTDAMIRDHVRLPAIVGAIERAFGALENGASAIFDVARGTGTDPSHFFAVKSGRDGSIPAIGLKAGSYNPANLQRGKPAHTSTTMLIGDEDGEPYAIVEANYLNGMRTAAADALAVRTLSRPDATTLSVVGWGAQAVFEVEAVAAERPIRRVLACGRDAARGAAFRCAVAERCGLQVECVNIETAVRAADILVTVTASRSPLFPADWVRPGTHVSAMGADDVGKQELPVELVGSARLFVDHPPQARLIGETQHAWTAGLVSAKALAKHTLGALLLGRVAGRTSDDEITVFDSSGIAIQDIAAAQAAVEIVRSLR